MIPVLIYLMPSCPKVFQPGFLSFWCSSSERLDITEESVIRLPSEGITPLCQAILAVEWLSIVNANTPLIITTTTELPLELISGQPLPLSTQAWLSEPDYGVLYFPRIDRFHRCSRQAIRRWNPLSGSITLESAWQQAKLSVCE